MDAGVIAAIVSGCFAVIAGIVVLILKPLVDVWEERWRERKRPRKGRSPPMVIDVNNYRPVPGDPRGLPTRFEREGKKGYMLPARGLSIQGGNNKKNWEWTKLRESRFEEVAVLRRRGSDPLEIHGKIEHEKLSPNINYAVNLIFRLSDDSEGLGCLFSATVEVFFTLSDVSIETQKRIVCLQDPLPEYVNEEVHEYPCKRHEDAPWMQVVLGEFFSGDGYRGDVQVRLTERDETECPQAGLIVEGIEFRPLYIRSPSKLALLVKFFQRERPQLSAHADAGGGAGGGAVDMVSCAFDSTTSTSSLPDEFVLQELSFHASDDPRRYRRVHSRPALRKQSLVPAPPPLALSTDHYKPISEDPRDFECNGKRGYILPARGLSILWGSNTNHWNWMKLDSSRFEEVAMLREVLWLDIRGKIKHEHLSPNTTYVVNLIFRLTDNSEGLGYPFQDAIVEILETRKRRVCLQHPPPTDGIEEVVDEVPREWDDDALWMQVMLGEIFSGDGYRGDVQVRLTARDKTYRKTGLIVAGIQFRPEDYSVTRFAASSSTQVPDQQSQSHSEHNQQPQTLHPPVPTELAAV